MEAGAVPITRVGGLTAAQQSFGAHERARRGTMTDVAASGTGAGKFSLPGLSDIGSIFKRADLAVAIGVMLILVVLILPRPPMLLDMALALSIILSVLILMTALFIQAPLEFSPSPPCS